MTTITLPTNEAETQEQQLTTGSIAASLERSSETATENIYLAIERLSSLVGVNLTFELQSRSDRDDPIVLAIHTNGRDTIEQAETIEATRNALANYFGNIARQFAALEASVRKLGPSQVSLSPAEYVISSIDGQELYRTPSEGSAHAFVSSYESDGLECVVEPRLQAYHEQIVDSWFVVKTATNAITFATTSREAAERFAATAGSETHAVITPAKYYGEDAHGGDGGEDDTLTGDDSNGHGGRGDCDGIDSGAESNQGEGARESHNSMST